MSHIFISYNRSDEDKRDEVIQELSKGGYSYIKGNLWYDKDGIKGGDEWYEEIKRNLDDSFLILLVLTENSIKSHWVTFEYAYTASQDIPILPIRFDEANVSDMPISFINYVDWSNFQTQLLDTVDSYANISELSYFSAQAIWQLFEPLMMTTRLCIWAYYEHGWEARKFSDIVEIMDEQTQSLKSQVRDLWLNHSHAFTRRQKIQLRHFSTVRHEIWRLTSDFLLPVVPEKSQTERDGAVQQLQQWLEELYETDIPDVYIEDFNSYGRVKRQFPFANDPFDEKFPKISAYLSRTASQRWKFTHQNNRARQALQRVLSDSNYETILNDPMFSTIK